MNNPKRDISDRPVQRCLSPIHRANRQAGIYIEDLLKDMGVSAPEAHIISFVGLYGPSSVGELVRVFGYRKPTMTSMLNKLEQRGCLTRELNRDDRRSLLISLTDAGRLIADESRRRVEDLDQKIMRRVSRTDLEGFQKVLAAIAEVTGVEVRKVKANGNPSTHSKE